MPIAFNEIPSNLRTHSSHVEFDGSLSGVATPGFKKAMFAQRLASGSVLANVPTRVTRKGDGAKYFGDNSYAARMCDAALAADRSIELWVVAQDDNVAGNAAAGSLTIDTVASANGTYHLYIGGVRIQTAVSSTDSDADIAAAIAAAINADKVVEVTASAALAVVTITAQHKGEIGNDIDIRSSYYGEDMPADMSVTIVPMSGGTGNPDLSASLAAMGDEWYNWMINPYTDAANLVTLDADLQTRWGPTRQIDARAFMGFVGTHAEAATFGNTQNSLHFSTVGTNLSPTPPYIWAAVNGSIAGKYLAINPVRPLQTLELPGILPPARELVWDQEERNQLLWDGISTYEVDAAGKVRIDHQITMYQTNPGGFNDETWLDINDPEFDSRLRYAQRALIAQRWPRHSLASDGGEIGQGAAVVTPKTFTVEMLALYKAWVLRGWAEDYDGYKDGFFAEVDETNKNRLNWQDRPNRVNQARTFAGKMQMID